MRSGCRLAVLFLATLVTACASSSGGEAPDAAPADAHAADATVADAGPPDAEPCLPDPKGEICNGEDDDCNGTIDDGYPGVGEECSVGVGACETAGTTVCTKDGESTRCNATAGTPGTELCANSIDDDCNGMTDEGFDNLGDVCSVGSGACLASGIFVCSSSGLTTVCNGTPDDPDPEICDGVDNNCDPSGLIDEGWQVGQQCDGADGDLCNEGVWACDGSGGRVCSDATGTTYDLCNGLDDDCDITSGDGSEDGTMGTSCDGAGPGQDSDLCYEGVLQCISGGPYCNDNTTSTLDVCDGANNDCDLGSADGSEDPLLTTSCDSTADTDLCATGTYSCGGGGSLVCSDDATSLTDICNGLDDDCDVASADGSEQATYGNACDGTDADSCPSGVIACNSGASALYCTDDAGTNPDICDGIDNDCNPATPDGSGETGYGVACDGADSDLCTTGGTWSCNSGTSTMYCTDDATSLVDTCDGVDNDCDAASADGSEQAPFGTACDGTDSDLCTTGGTWACNGAALYCTDDATSILDTCGNGDDDCDPASADGTEHSGYNTACDSADSDLCTGNMVCSGTSLVCNDDLNSALDVCDGADNDCDAASADGSEQATYGNACDNPLDSDLCATGAAGGTIACNGSALYCTDDIASAVDTCNGLDDDCDSASPDGSEAATYGNACDGTDSDLCTTGGQIACNSITSALYCTDDATSLTDLCDGADNDCDPASADGTEQSGYNAACDSSVDSDLCTTGQMKCNGAALYCNDPDGDSTLDLCGNGNEDCDGASADGSEQTGFGDLCDSADSDLCATGNKVCSGTTLVCNDPTNDSTLDYCGNGDEDCDINSNDGTEHPGYGANCDGTDSDFCTTGTNLCSGTSLVCTDDAASTTETCNGTDEDCDGAIDDGWSGNDNTACWSVNLTPTGSIRGDAGTDVRSASSWNEEWYIAYISEDSNSDIYLSATAQLYSPPGTDFDLYLYCFDCGTSVVAQSTNHSLTGHTDTVYHRGNDDTPIFGEDDGHWILIEVRYYDQNRCDSYTLTVTGNTAVSTVTCNI